MNLLHEIGSHLTGLEQLQVMITKDLRLGIGETPDIRLIEVDEGRVALEATLDVHLYNPAGTVHELSLNKPGASSFPIALARVPE